MRYILTNIKLSNGIELKAYKPLNLAELLILKLKEVLKNDL